MAELPAKWVQAYPPTDAAGPTAADRILDRALQDFTIRNVKKEDERELVRKRKVLLELNKLHNEWVRECGALNGVTEMNGNPVVGKMETSGSWKLAIHEKDADIDLICIAPRFCTYELFFSLLGDKLRNDDRVTNFNAIPGAFVPIMTFDFRGVNIDLLLSVLPHASTVPYSLDILDDELLSGMSEPARRSVNGPRDTMVIRKLVRSAGSRLLEPPDADARYENFLKAVRCVRLWAKKRGIYSNKAGYLGGINFNILMTLVIQMFPQKSAGQLFMSFFKLYAAWAKDPAAHEENLAMRNVRWMDPVRLCAEQNMVNASLDQEVYPNMGKYGPKKGDMPIVTPSYPAYNSAGNVNTWSLAIMNEEFARGAQLASEIDRLADAEARGEGTANLEQIAGLMDKLVEPSNFFWRPDYHHFLEVSIRHTATDEASAATEQHFEDFKTLTEAMFRNVAVWPKWKNLGDFPVVRIHSLPKPFEAEAIVGGQSIAEPSSASSSNPSEGGSAEAMTEDSSSSAVALQSTLPKLATMWISFVPDRHRYKDDKLQAGQLFRNFEDLVKKRFEKDEGCEGRAAGMSITPSYYKQKDLPDYVFDLSDFGKERAMALRKEERQKLLAELQRREEELRKLKQIDDSAMDGEEVEGEHREFNQAVTVGDAIRTSDAVISDRLRAPSKHAVTTKPLWRAVAEAHRNLPILGKPGDMAANLSSAAPPLSVGALALARTAMVTRKRNSIDSSMASVLGPALDDLEHAHEALMRKRIRAVKFLRGTQSKN
jgi:poly(A) polymerase Pap1